MNGTAVVQHPPVGTIFPNHHSVVCTMGCVLYDFDGIKQPKYKLSSFNFQTSSVFPPWNPGSMRKKNRAVDTWAADDKWKEDLSSTESSGGETDSLYTPDRERGLRENCGKLKGAHKKGKAMSGARRPASAKRGKLHAGRNDAAEDNGEQAFVALLRREFPNISPVEFASAMARYKNDRKGEGAGQTSPSDKRVAHAETPGTERKGKGKRALHSEGSEEDCGSLNRAEIR